MLFRYSNIPPDLFRPQARKPDGQAFIYFAENDCCQAAMLYLCSMPNTTRILPASSIRILACVIMLLAPSACGNGDARRIIDRSIREHGGEAINSVIVAFDFRNRHYTATFDKGAFTYTREFKDSTGSIKDVLTNSTFVRYRNGLPIPLTEERKNAFTNSVNSVIYFALLPWFLNDPAVNRSYIGPTTIEQQPYQLVRVTFDEKGGGADYQDVFLYWFHQETHRMDYFAYTYHTDGGGLRFRQAVNPRRIGGILFQDYINYKPATDQVPLDQLQAMFESGKLEKLSEIRLQNIYVTHIGDKLQ